MCAATNSCDVDSATHLVRLDVPAEVLVSFEPNGVAGALMTVHVSRSRE